MTTKVAKVTKKDIYAELFRRGDLRWLLYKHQRPVYDKIREVLVSESTNDNSYCLDISRQYGKSFTMFLIAVEECLRNEFRTIVYVGPLKSQVIEIVTEKTFRTVFEHAPNDLVPKLNGSALEFKNGSRIRLSGTDNHHYENLRGGMAHTILLDEAGFMDNLDVGVLPSVTPMLKTTGGKIIYASTPPATLDHPYIQILRDHEEWGLISTFTIHDDKSLTQKQFDAIVASCKGTNTTLFKREYECKRIVESSMQVIPELNEDLAKKLILDIEYQDNLMQYWQKYIVIDTGMRDKTAAIFAHYNYRTKKVVVDDMLDLQGTEYSTAKLAQMIKDRRDSLWSNEAQKDLRYIADSNNQIVIQDLNVTYKLPFVGTTKGRLEEMVQKVRDWFYDERIVFKPTAIEVLNCARYAIWSKQRDQFGRSSKYGHYDALAALTYLIRNVTEHVDPVPAYLGLDPNTHFIPPNSSLSRTSQELNKLFNPKKGLSYRN